MMPQILLQLSETDKRILIAVCLVLILVFIIAGYIGVLTARIMTWQGKRLDTMMSDIVITRVVEDKKGFLKVARKKNWRYFFKTAWIPFLVLIFSFIILFIAEAIYEFTYDIFDYHKQGFTTLLFLWDFNDPEIYTDFFGIKIIASWPPLLNSPHFEIEAIWSYLFVPIFLTGAIWYLICLQCLIARTIRMYKLADSVYSKSLEGFNINEENMQQMRMNQANLQQMRWNQAINQVNQQMNQFAQNQNNQNNITNNPPIIDKGNIDATEGNKEKK